MADSSGAPTPAVNLLSSPISSQKHRTPCRANRAEVQKQMKHNRGHFQQLFFILETENEMEKLKEAGFEEERGFLAFLKN